MVIFLVIYMFIHGCNNCACLLCCFFHPFVLLYVCLFVTHSLIKTSINLFAGLISEASWLSNNLGDWKHSLLLSTSHTLHPSNHTTILLHTPPRNITPENIIITRLEPILTTPQTSLSSLPKYIVDTPEDATSTPNKERLMVENRGGKAQARKMIRITGMI